MGAAVLIPETPAEVRSNVRRSAGRHRLARWSLLGPMAIFFLLAFALPLLTVFRYAFDKYVPGTGQQEAWSLESLNQALTTPVFRELLVRTVLLALVTTLISIVLSYPLALVITRGPRLLRPVIMAILMMPLMTSVVVKTFGWSVLLGEGGVIREVLLGVGIDVKLLFTPAGVVIGLVHTYMPFMALSLIAALSTINRSTEQAARSLGSRPSGVFFKVTLPQTRAGLAAGTVLTFVTSLSALVIPQILGGGKTNTLVTAMYQQANGGNWPLASALGLVLLVVTLVILALHALGGPRGEAA